MNKINFYNLVIIIAAVICAVFLYNIAAEFLHDRTLERILSAELAVNKISGRDLVGKIRHAYIEKRYWVSDSFSFDDFEKKFQRSLEKAGFKLLSSARVVKKNIVRDPKESREEAYFLIAERSSDMPIFRLTLIHRIHPKPAPQPAAKVPVTAVPETKPAQAPGTEESVYTHPKMAVVLDDWGYNTNNLDAILKVGKPITLSILPGLPYSTLIARKAKERGLEVIVHMPMEPKAKIKLEMATLRADMTEDEIRSNLSKAFQSVPNAVGISNHEGSKATEDRKLMKVVFLELKKNNMFFLDSLVTNYSVCETEAKEAGVKFVKRSVFLDNENNPEYIKGQFEKAINLAIKTGSAVAIGHDRPVSVAVLKEMIPVIEAKGIEITYVSNLAR